MEARTSSFPTLASFGLEEKMTGLLPRTGAGPRRHHSYVYLVSFGSTDLLLAEKKTPIIITPIPTH